MTLGITNNIMGINMGG